MSRTVLLHVSGMLVDDAYIQAMAWLRALRAAGVEPSAWRVHQALGAGPAAVVLQVGGDAVAAAHGADLVALQARHLADLLDDVRPVDGARGLVVDLAAAGFQVVLAGWDGERVRQRYVELLGLTGGDVVHHCAAPTVPAEGLLADAAPDLAQAVVVSDSVWGLVAATRLRHAAIGVRTGAFSVRELRTAGAQHVYESVHDLHRHIEATALARPDLAASDVEPSGADRPGG